MEGLQVILKKIIDAEKNIANLSVMKTGIKDVPDSTSYVVDTDSGVCTCPIRESGAICKHQVFFAQNFGDLKFMPIPTNPSRRALLLLIATGIKDVPDKWFAPLLENCKDSGNCK